MEYQKQNFQDGEILTAEKLNHMEDGIADVTRCASNPNLLDNWYFADPINQRCVTNGQQFTNEYCYDRWKILNIATITKDAEGITINPVQYEAWFEQKFSDVFFVGKTVTMSVLIKGKAEVYLEGWYVEAAIIHADCSQWMLYSKTFFIPDEAPVTGLRMKTVDSSTPFSIKAVKLEIGSVQTLARQENGAWVLNDTQPNKALELAKCQSYYEKSVWQAAFGRADDANNIYACNNYFFKATKRTHPVVSVNAYQHQNPQAIRVSTGEVVSDIQILPPTAVNTGMLCPRLYSPSGAFVPNELYRCEFGDDAYLISADL